MALQSDLTTGKFSQSEIPTPHSAENTRKQRNNKDKDST
jgi:hypothetical protein